MVAAPGWPSLTVAPLASSRMRPRTLSLPSPLALRLPIPESVKPQVQRRAPLPAEENTATGHRRRPRPATYVPGVLRTTAAPTARAGYTIVKYPELSLRYATLCRLR